MPNVTDSNCAAVISPYEGVEKDLVIRPIYPLKDVEEFLDEVKLGWVKGLKEVGNLDGARLYWNPEIARKVLNYAINKRKLTPIRAKIFELFKKARIVPAFASKTMFGLIVSRISHVLFGKFTVLAFFYQKTEAIYLILESMSSISFSVETNDEKIATVLLHELLHFSAFNQHSLFYSTFKKDLLNWYSYYFSKMFDCNRKDKNFLKQCLKIVNLLSGTDKGTSKIESIWKKYVLEVDKFKKFSKVSNFEERKAIHFSYLYFYLTGQTGKFFTVLRRTQIAKYMFEAYKFGLNLGSYPNTLVVQELIFPSEIICCVSELKATSKMFSVINSIKVK